MQARVGVDLDRPVAGEGLVWAGVVEDLPVGLCFTAIASANGWCGSMVTICPPVRIRSAPGCFCPAPARAGDPMPRARTIDMPPLNSPQRRSAATLPGRRAIPRPFGGPSALIVLLIACVPTPHLSLVTWPGRPWRIGKAWSRDVLGRLASSHVPGRFLRLLGKVWSRRGGPAGTLRGCVRRSR
jgi:hypothetical protein